MTTDYLSDPSEIYKRSFETIRAEADFTGMSPAMETLAVRVIHACGMVDVLDGLRWSDGAAEAGRQALESGATVLVDANMVGAGIIRDRLPARNAIVCTLTEPDIQRRAEALSTTRSAAAVDLWGPHMGGAVVAIGNAPTALFHLMELLDQGFPPPALILGFPVGFVGAVESKAALAERIDLPFITLKGRRGGSAMASAAVNALSGPLS